MIKTTKQTLMNDLDKCFRDGFKRNRCSRCNRNRDLQLKLIFDGDTGARYMLENYIVLCLECRILSTLFDESWSTWVMNNFPDRYQSLYAKNLETPTLSLDYLAALKFDIFRIKKRC